MHDMAGVRFLFIQTEQMPIERVQMGWELNEYKYPYLLDSHCTPFDTIQELLFKADVIIYGDTHLDFYKVKLKPDVLILYYRERLFKKNTSLNILRFIKLHYIYAIKNRSVNSALLCASAYASVDFSRIRAFRGKKYKWGYFPATRKRNFSEIKNIKKANRFLRILWVGRMIPWKRGLDALKLAKILKDEHQTFRMDFIGTGELESSFRMFSQQNNLEDVVSFLGSMPQAQVRRHMEKSDIFLMTSDYNEGWGAVVNEAMNSGCAVVVSHAAGSAPFLIQNGHNGFLYECGNVGEMYQCVKKCIETPKLRYELGLNAYHTIVNEWNASIAVERLLELIVVLKKKEDGKGLFGSGICSVAEELKNSWWMDKEVMP